MAELRYKFTNDTLFKMVFVKYPGLLKRLVAGILKIPFEDISDFTVTNTEMPPEELLGKLCRLDINMAVNGRLLDLEVQVNDEHDYPERSLFLWAREFSSALPEGKTYIDLPETIVISILAFPLFDCKEFYSEFRPLEVARGTQLTNKQCLCYFELPKIPDDFDESDELMWWLTLFGAETEENLSIIESKGGTIMSQAVAAYRHVSATDEFKKLERMRADARRQELAVRRNAQRLGIQEGMQQGIQKGIQQGIQEGELAKALEVAKKLQAKGFSTNDIVDATGLTVDDVLRL